MIRISTSGSFKHTDRFLSRMANGAPFKTLEQYGQEGVNALASATPVASGITANSWTYEISDKNGQYSISWHNTNVVSGVPVVILLQYGHATGTGGWVEGTDFINPAIKPVFDKIAKQVWKKVTSE